MPKYPSVSWFWNASARPVCFDAVLISSDHIGNVPSRSAIRSNTPTLEQTPGTKRKAKPLDKPQMIHVHSAQGRQFCAWPLNSQLRFALSMIAGR